MPRIVVSGRERRMSSVTDSRNIPDTRRSPTTMLNSADEGQHHLDADGVS